MPKFLRVRWKAQERKVWSPVQPLLLAFEMERRLQAEQLAELPVIEPGTGKLN